MKRMILMLVLGAVMAYAQDMTQRLNLPEERGWDKAARFTVTDRVWPAAHGEADVCLWANDKMAAVSFSIDDNVVPDHAWWCRQMDKHGWKTTWFVIVQYLQAAGNPGYFGTWDNFRDLYSKGHAIGSHTMTHGHCNDPSYDMGIACPAILTGGRCCDINYEYGEAQKIIRDSIPGNQCLTIAYSGHTVTGRTATVAGTTFTYDSYAHEPDTAAKYYIAGRGTVGRPSIPGRIWYLNTNMGSIDSNWIDNVITLNPSESHYWRGWIAHYIHGVNDTSGMADRFDYIKSREADLWVELYENIAKYGQSRDTRVLTVDDVTATQISFTLTDSMVDSVYTYPLTVKVRVNNDWDTVYALQNGSAIDAEIIEHEANKYVLVQAVPDGGQVKISKTETTQLVDRAKLVKAASVLTPSRVIYDCMGKPVSSGRELKPGLYLMREGSRITKIMVLE